MRSYIPARLFLLLFMLSVSPLVVQSIPLASSAGTELVAPPGPSERPQPSASQSSAGKTQVPKWIAELRQRVETAPATVKWGVGLYLVLQALWLLLLVARPLALLKSDSLLESLGIPKFKILGVEGSIQALLLLPLFLYRDRVLDGWVERHVKMAEKGLKDWDSSKNFGAYVRAPVKLTDPVTSTDMLVSEPTVKDFQKFFVEWKTRLVIWGNGGSGKSSLAYQLALWALEEEKTQRVCEHHRMIPVVIHSDMARETSQDPAEALEEKLSKYLKEGSGDEPHNKFVKKLLERGRVLVIVDGLSEKTDQTREVVDRACPARVVITSRQDESTLLSSYDVTCVQPCPLQGTSLWLFMHAYLGKLGKRILLSDREFFMGCERLSMAVGNREITAGIASLYAQRMVRAKSLSGNKAFIREDLRSYAWQG